MSDKKDPKDKLKEFMDPKGDNFMGTGMSLQEMIMLGRGKEIERSYVIADKEERERRLSLVLELAVVLGEILGTGERFGTGILRQDIGAVILGDWDDVKTGLSFSEGEGLEEHSYTRCPDLYAQFYAILRRAHETRPGGEVPPTIQ